MKSRQDLTGLTKFEVTIQGHAEDESAPPCPTCGYRSQGVEVAGRIICPICGEVFAWVHEEALKNLAEVVADEMAPLLELMKTAIIAFFELIKIMVYTLKLAFYRWLEIESPSTGRIIGDVYDTGEDVFSALRSGMFGEVDSLKKVGITISRKEAFSEYRSNLPWYRQWFWPWLSKKEKQLALCDAVVKQNDKADPVGDLVKEFESDIEGFFEQ